MKEAIPLCINCKWFIQNIYTDDYAMCAHDREEVFNVVDGWSPGPLHHVYEYRSASGKCGPDGRFWELSNNPDPVRKEWEDRYKRRAEHAVQHANFLGRWKAIGKVAA